MNIAKMKTTLIDHYPHIELTYDKQGSTIKLENLHASVRFGMGYRWNLILYLESFKVKNQVFECCTFDNTSGNFCKILAPTKMVEEKAKKVLELLGFT